MNVRHVGVLVFLLAQASFAAAQDQLPTPANKRAALKAANWLLRDYDQKYEQAQKEHSKYSWLTLTGIGGILLGGGMFFYAELPSVLIVYFSMIGTFWGRSEMAHWQEELKRIDRERPPLQEKRRGLAEHIFRLDEQK